MISLQHLLDLAIERSQLGSQASSLLAICRRLGQLAVEGKPLKTLVTDVPGELNAVLNKLGLLPLFASPPSWATA